MQHFACDIRFRAAVLWNYIWYDSTRIYLLRFRRIRRSGRISRCNPIRQAVPSVNHHTAKKFRMSYFIWDFWTLIIISSSYIHTGWAKKVIPLVHILHGTRGITFLAHPVLPLSRAGATLGWYFPATIENNFYPHLPVSAILPSMHLGGPGPGVWLVRCATLC